MAEQLQAIKRRIKSIESTEKIANAMQLVAAAKLKQATNRFNYSKDHLTELASLFKREVDSFGFEEDRSAYTKPHEIAPSLTIVITASKGMCGSYNSSIIKELGNVEAMTTFLPLGSKGYEYVKAHDLPLLEDYILGLSEEDPIAHEEIKDRLSNFYGKPSEEHSYEEILDLATRILARQHNGELAEVHLVYASYKNSISYEVVNKNILPVYNTGDNVEIIPKLAELLAIRIYQAIAEASLNEYGARRLAMKNASDSAEEMLTGLETAYHRARQSEITDELIEIISGTESQRALEKESKKRK